MPVKPGNLIERIKGVVYHLAEKLKIIPLGGLNEIGKNITVLEYGKDMIVVDCGVGFPEEDMYGVDLVIPDFTYLVKNQGKVFSINQIYESIWNEDAIGADNTVAVHIRHIREKIEINPKEPRYLKVVWGVGYKIEKN